jgi:DNA-binding transcriptional regulator/RsmH inhibitor MraZ
VIAGAFDCTLGSDFRICLPREFASFLTGGGSHVTLVPLPRCLALIPRSVYRALPREELAAYRRSLLAVSGEPPCAKPQTVRIDRRRRLTIPRAMRRYLQEPSRQLVLCGLGNRAEIWARSAHEAELKRTRQMYRELESSSSDSDL